MAPSTVPKLLRQKMGFRTGRPESQRDVLPIMPKNECNLFGQPKGQSVVTPTTSLPRKGPGQLHEVTSPSSHTSATRTMLQWPYQSFPWELANYLDSMRHSVIENPSKWPLSTSSDHSRINQKAKSTIAARVWTRQASILPRLGDFHGSLAPLVCDRRLLVAKLI
ncbi:hypothetical protein L228DRAFT_107251 [Xylona heveae TC161]|uniref:Uncharacterized protein n=1 Tax=Xylona heveae (strain CBS 132557 / TC161) TaxID=1328760 RepID=A0A165HBL5_XYLHT|nr:hypothetical protein L228DRAFT_107251 [Xylona heveae TC161]KZF23261.1 hypothetical protein L228DRAFT_107251 [Xylona heveae TC161]